MTAIGGKTKLKKASQPQFVVQVAWHINEYALFKTDDNGILNIHWVGDPNAATKFDSKYAAKFRVRELADIPTTRCFKQLENISKHASGKLDSDKVIDVTLLKRNIDCMFLES